MVKLKYQAMTENAFRYDRGTCHLFYEGLAGAEKFPALVPWEPAQMLTSIFIAFVGLNIAPKRAQHIARLFAVRLLF